VLGASLELLSLQAIVTSLRRNHCGRKKRKISIAAKTTEYGAKVTVHQALPNPSLPRAAALPPANETRFVRNGAIMEVSLAVTAAVTEPNRWQRLAKN